MKTYYSAKNSGFYNDEIHSENIPSDAVEISENTHSQLLNEQSRGKLIVPNSTGQPIAVEPPSLSVDELKTSAKKIIDSAAEASRLKFITPGSGQSIVYELKRAESERYLAATNPVDTDYRLMLERATRKGVALSVIANEWKTQSDALVSLAATIEGLREGAKDAIDTVADDAKAQTNIDAIVNGITWPQPV